MPDKIDEQILETLRRDSRTPITELAKKVGRSRTAIQARLSKLERAQLILGYTIKEPSIVETDGVGAIVLVSMEVRNKGDSAAREFATIPEIATCMRIVGDHDFALIVKPIEKPRLNFLLERIYMIDGVKGTETILSLSKEF